MSNNISRRNSLVTMGAISAAGMVRASWPSVSKAAGPDTHATALAIVGDRYHNPDYIKTALNKTLVKEAGLSIDYLWEDAYFTEELLNNYKILIMFRDGMVHPEGYFGWYTGLDPYGNAPNDTEIKSDPPLPKIGGEPVAWMTKTQGKAIKKFVRNGGSLCAFHNNSNCSLMNKDYRDVEGAIYTGHPPIRPFKVKIVNLYHPITKGIKDFIVTDEQHYVTYDKDPKYVLAISVNEDGLDFTDNAGRKSHTCESVWAYDYGKGRVCFMGPGHMICALWNPEYEKMQKNAIKWLLKET